MILTLKNYKASIKLLTKDKLIATSICDALAPDLKTLQNHECSTEVFLDDSSVIFRMETQDIATLRASVNAYLRLSDVSYQCLQYS